MEKTQKKNTICCKNIEKEQKKQNKKHPCKDCKRCLWCADSKCEMCQGWLCGS